MTGGVFFGVSYRPHFYWVKSAFEYGVELDSDCVLAVVFKIRINVNKSVNSCRVR